MLEEFLGQNSARGNLKLSTHIKWFKVVLLPCKSTPYQFSSITTNFPLLKIHSVSLKENVSPHKKRGVMTIHSKDPHTFYFNPLTPECD